MRRISNRPRLFSAQMCRNPRKVNAFGFPSSRSSRFSRRNTRTESAGSGGFEILDEFAAGFSEFRRDFDELDGDLGGFDLAEEGIRIVIATGTQMHATARVNEFETLLGRV